MEVHLKNVTLKISAISFNVHKYFFFISAHDGIKVTSDMM